MNHNYTAEELIREGYEFACESDEVSAVMPKLVEIQGRGVLICRSNDAFYAVDEICPHKQKSMAHGIVFDGDIICPWHSYAFNLETGRSNQRRCVPAYLYELQIINGQIYVRL